MKRKNVEIGCSPWEEPKKQIDKFSDGEGASLADGLSARVEMHGEEDAWKGRGPSIYRKTEGPVR